MLRGVFVLLASTAANACPALPPVEVAPGGHYLVAGGKPFFWLGDTAWELVHATTDTEAAYYLHTRAAQGFTVVQTVVLSEFDGLTKPTPGGLLPFHNGDPAHPNAAYFARVVRLVDQAACLGLRVALVPAWGDKLTAPWGAGPRLFTTANLPVARAYGRYLGALLRGRTNVVWLLGGDRPARLAGLKNAYLQAIAAKAGFAPDADWTAIWRAIAAGLREGQGTAPLIVFHPQGGDDSSSQQLAAEPWLSVNGMQSGHGGGHDQPVWTWIARDWAASPTRPTLDLEPNYEDHPYNPWPRWDASTGYFDDYDVRKQVYRSVFAGGAGVSYGHHSVWGFVGPRNDVINHAKMDWVSALDRPGARQMVHLRDLMLSRPFASRVPDDALLVGGQGERGRHIVATRGDGYALVYIPTSDTDFTVDLARIGSARTRAWWFDPRAGVAAPAGEFPGKGRQTFTTPPTGPDWVLVLDDAAARFAPPGLRDPAAR